ncbi:MAG: thioredoxin domain-containing protein [Dehalococcoidia bacterium]
MSNDRRRRRAERASNRTRPTSPVQRRAPASRGGLRGTIDSFGGPVTVGAIGLALVFVIGLVFLNRPGSSIDNTPFEPKERAQVDAKTWGDPLAPVRIVMFEDFQCPVCRRFTEELEPQLASEFIETGRVVVEYHHMAFLGAESVAAASASECANEQGAFWPYHDILFLRQGAENAGVFSTSNLKTFAEQMAAAIPDLGWDQAAFDACVDGGQTTAIVEAETGEARTAGVSSTPSFLVNGEAIVGLPTYDSLRSTIERVEAAASGGS